ncbi:cysteine-rich receptor-like protein kinase 8 [Tanacetum coccineum]
MVTSSSKNTNTNTILPQDDINSPHHPLYFHPYEHTGLLLIAKKLNRSDNYRTWKRSMLIALSAKNKPKLINGEYDEPSIESRVRAYWERSNDMLISWILNTISEQIGNHLTFVNSTFAIWSELNAYTPSYRNNQPNNPTNATQNERMNSFRTGIFCSYCKKEDHPKEECYKILGYPPVHPLHNKYQLPSQRAPSTNMGHRSLNMMTGDTLPPMDTPLHSMNLPDQCSTSNTSDIVESQVHARMDEL